MHLRPFLLFDLGGVLIESTAFENLSRLLPEPCGPDQIKRRWLASPSVRTFECGNICAEEFAAQFIAEWHIDLSPQAFIDELTGWPRRLYPGAKELIRSLSKCGRVGCLSNSNPIHWEKFSTELSELFDVTLYSHQLGAVKPDPEIFLKALQQCRVPAHEVVFFDDCQANVQAAQSVGIRASRANGFSSLIKCLHQHDLLPVAERDYFSATVPDSLLDALI